MTTRDRLQRNAHQAALQTGNAIAVGAAAATGTRRSGRGAVGEQEGAVGGAGEQQHRRYMAEVVYNQQIILLINVASLIGHLAFASGKQANRMA